MIIGIDVDLTIVDTLTPWIEWYTFKTGHNLMKDFEKQTDHGLNVQKLMINHSNPLEFWKKPDLYDDLKPLDSVQQVVRTLKENGHEIVFVSYCFPEHIESKVSFLRRHFGTDIKFVDTKHKEFLKLDLFFDDHSEFIDNVKESSPECICIQKKTNVNSISEKSDFNFEFWFEVDRILKHLKVIK